MVLVALAAVPLAAYWLRQAAPPELYDHTRQRPGNAQVAALLEGEQLVPPPSLPPELFLQAEVQSARPLIGSANREWALLDAEFRQRLLAIFRLMQERHGYELVLLEGYRSAERQAALQALGPTVTLAGANDSYHQYGLAADIAFVREGRIVLSERDAWALRGYELYGALAQELGLTWGGTWTRLRDLGHIELPRAGVIRGR
ncbi:M15 family metallopeptidase [Roseateles sp. BYS87W]|uniref:M15 family metallopeptidase n=1 Tax=Pelomonas baiyunensis TaxID=3299026 RepID=A0ABW7H4B2_9BURK